MCIEGPYVPYMQHNYVYGGPHRTPMCNMAMCLVGPIKPLHVIRLCVWWAPSMAAAAVHTHTHGSGRPVQAQSWQPWDPWCWWWWYTSLNIGQLLPHNRLYQLVHLAHMPQLQPANRKICLIAGLSYWSREYSGNLMNILEKMYLTSRHQIFWNCVRTSDCWFKVLDPENILKHDWNSPRYSLYFGSTCIGLEIEKNFSILLS